MWHSLTRLDINKLSLVPISFNLSNEGTFTFLSPSYNLTSDDLWPWYMTFDDMNIQRVPYCINKPSLVWIGLQLFKWGHFYFFYLSYNLTLICDLWPHQQMRVPMLQLWPNFGWNPSRHVEGKAKCLPVFTPENNRQQHHHHHGTKWSLRVFPAKAGETKSSK